MPRARLLITRKARTFATAAICLGVALTGFMAPIPANAQKTDPIVASAKQVGKGGMPVMVTGDLSDQVGSVVDSILTQLTRAGVVAFFNTAQTFFGQLAYDAANYLASGGKGQGALVYEKGFGAYMEQVGSDALGEFIGSLSDDSFFKELGFDLCKPPDVKNLLSIQMSLGSSFPGMQGRFERPKPRCDFQDIIKNYDKFYTTLTSLEVSDYVNVNFSPGGSEIGVSASILGRAVGKISLEKEKASKDRSEGDGFKAVQNVISGKVKTPASVVQESIKTDLVNQPKADQAQQRNIIMQNAFEEGPIQLAVYTASVFLNTLGSKMMERIMEKGLIGAFDWSDQYAKRVIGVDSVSVAGKTDARRANIGLKNVNLIKTSDIELVSELIACPQSRGLWNCTVDQSLGQAIQSRGQRENVTIQDALAKDFLHGSWRLIPVSNARENFDPQCFSYAYCASNLQKLRLLRILPVGFEFAANSPENVERCSSSAGCVTFQEVVEGFAECNDAGERDSSHPWCKLVNPNWIITAFPQKCELTGFGETLLTNRLAQRKEECRDIQTCLKRNDKGECVGGYGYCMAERNAYRFNADECPAHYASCRTFANRSGSEISYLRNTLDPSVCSAENVGCLGYLTQRSPEGTWQGSATTGSKMYFDSTTKPCAANDEGCTKLYAAETGTSALNLLVNPSFERVAGTPVVAEGWQTEAQVTTTVAEGRPAEHGNASLVLPAAGSYRQDMAIKGGNVYVLSFSARLRTGTAGSVNARITQLTDTGATISNTAMERDFRGGSCVDTRTATDKAPALASGALTTSWTRVECTFLANTSSAEARLTLSGVSGATLIDAVQLEEGQYATAFVDGLNASLPIVHMKVAPDDFNCKGTASDPEGCKKFAKVCRQMDAGCQGYTDLVGGPEVPAILSSNDLCPQSCVGYSEYRKAPSSFDLIQDTDSRFSDPTDATSSHFIATTGQKCSQADAGCEVFTNVEAAASGGEQSRGFSYLRSCEKPGPNSKTFFTWEGSDTAGFQLRTWSLIATSPSGGPQSLVKRAPGTTQIKESDSCNESTWRTGVDPDCRQFYDAAGSVFYAYYSQTVLSSDQCSNWRLNRSSEADCLKTHGAFDRLSNECIYQVFVPESRSCQAQFAGCRAFTGAGSGNAQSIFSQDFRSGADKFSGGAISSESLLVGDSSYRIEPDRLGFTRATTSVPTQSDGLYQVAFWAKAPARTDVTLTVKAGDVVAGSVVLGSDWQRYVIGLWNGANGAETVLTFSFTHPGGAPTVFLDEVRVTRVRDVAYVIKDSWRTPIECDRSAAGAPEPQAMLGCRAYRDRFENRVNAFRFTSLCRQESIGCRAFVDTRNSDGIASQTFVMADATSTPIFNLPTDRASRPSDFYPAATTTREADRLVYLIYEKSKLCKPENASCRAFGKPEFLADRTGFESVKTVYFKDEVTRYGESLCRPSEEFCEEYSHSSGKDYFRDPKTHTCQYKEGQRLSFRDFSGDPILGEGGSRALADGIYSGWFRTGTTYPCEPTYIQSGNFFAISRRGDTGYAGWGASCPRSVAECTEFRDPNDTTDPVFRQSGRPYYFIDNDRLDKTSCAGNVDVGRGCILLRDMSNTALNYSVAASYNKYEANSFRPTPPVDCSKADRDPVCDSTYQVGYATTTDTNTLLKVRVDRDCAQWLGCQSAETVFDQATNRYRDVCTNLALCDQASNVPGDIFCSNYANRLTTTTEPILTRGAYFNTERYTSRAVGLGALDYSGYSIPNAFLVPDLASTRVGAEGATDDPKNERKYALDFRLAAKVPILVNSSGQPIYVPGVSLARIVSTASDAPALQALARTYPDLNLCVHVETGIIGYYSKIESDDSRNTHKPFACYLPVHAETDASYFNNVAEKFFMEDPRTDRVLTNAFPPPECRAYPQADAAFPASYVADWDFSKNPPEAVTKLNGFENANTCEHGEDCVCTYKRADFGIGSKFYSPLSQNVPPGICLGGPRNGQACLPGTIFKVQAASSNDAGQSTSLKEAVLAANGSQTCGPLEGGGTCVAFSRLEIVRGVFGQCLERDQSRFLGADMSNRPCLTWNPTPILFGDKDAFHYQPTAGYLPPQNSGQYYCLSPSRRPVTLRLNQHSFQRFNDDGTLATAANPTTFSDYQGFDPLKDHHWVTPNGTDRYGNQYIDGPKYAGRMTRMEFDEQWISPDNRCGTSGENECEFRSSSLVGVSQLAGYPSAKECELADEAQGANGYGHQDFEALRLVDAGSGYTETFFRINETKVALGLGVPDPAEGGAAFSRERDEVLSDVSIGYFKITPIDNKEAGRLACGYQAAWVDGMPVTDYASGDSVKQAESMWRNNLNREYNPFISRSTEKVLTQPFDEKPVLANCVMDDSSATDKCYFKTWGTEYRAKNEDQKFISLFNRAGETIRNFNTIREAPFVSTCEKSKPYFGIRAVFQSQESGARAPTVESLESREWKFVGFWVSACGGETGGDQRYIYMHIDMGSVSMCEQLAEVKSSVSNQDAAFTDRVWKSSQYRETGTGIQYIGRSAPFSSALNTRPAGKDPLFQEGFEIAGFSPDNPPTFLQPGSQTYYRSRAVPRDKWAFLSNLFGRIYRVYYYYPKPVAKEGQACILGPMKGRACLQDRDCELSGVCKASRLSRGDKQNIRVCNRGASALQECSDRSEICSAPSYVDQNGEFQMALNNCKLIGGNTKCEAGSADDGDSSCSEPTTKGSVECPVKIDGSTCTSNVCHLNSASIARLNTAYGSLGLGSPVADSSGGTLFFGSPKICNDVTQCDFSYNDLKGSLDVRATCEMIKEESTDFGRCDGGFKNGALCLNYLSTPAVAAATAVGLDCKPAFTGIIEADDYRGSYDDVCKFVSTHGRGPTASRQEGDPYIPIPECHMPLEESDVVATTSDDPDNDNNICTHGIGYYPRVDLCPDPSDEYCGLFSYNVRDTASGGSLDPASKYPLPTDVTLGHYTPLYLGFFGSGRYAQQKFDDIDYYTPRPPRLAAPDTRRCASPGSCPISRLDAFAFNGAAAGLLNVGGGLHKSTLQFYAWAAHNQMAIRQILVDWGDGKSQRLEDTRLKNRKPFCGVQKECSDPIYGAGITCQTDSDCPPMAGECKPLGACSSDPGRYCRIDDDCTVGTRKDTCKPRTMFGNSSEACQANYFDFSHLYQCGYDEREDLPACAVSRRTVPAGYCYFGDTHPAIIDTRLEGVEQACSTTEACGTIYTSLYSGGFGVPEYVTCLTASREVVGPSSGKRCSRNPDLLCDTDSQCAPGDSCIAGLAPVSGCFDAAANACRFTPRVLVMDNWGWCTGECRASLQGGLPDDASVSRVLHPYGGCYSGGPLGVKEPTVRVNSALEYTERGGLIVKTVLEKNECNEQFPSPSYPNVRPWAVYPGALQLQYSGESR